MNIIINGGTRGIGKEVVKFFAKNSEHRIIATGRDEETLISLSSDYPNVKSYKLDITDYDTAGIKFIEWLSSVSGNIDILINLSGLLIAKDFIETTSVEGRMMMETNFIGPASLIRSVRPFMVPGSHIVNISSMGGFQGSSKYKGLSYYSSSKAAMSCLTECLAVELAEFGISINCLALGAVQTEMLSQAFPGYQAPLDAIQMAEFVCNFALTGNKFFNGKILPVAVSNP
jgi:NAD(P)-dependent dehydrogenase (short-subunit alcohol dehydrogenase family)